MCYIFSVQLCSVLESERCERVLETFRDFRRSWWRCWINNAILPTWALLPWNFSLLRTQILWRRWISWSDVQCVQFCLERIGEHNPVLPVMIAIRLFTVHSDCREQCCPVYIFFSFRESSMQAVWSINNHSRRSLDLAISPISRCGSHTWTVWDRRREQQKRQQQRHIGIHLRSFESFSQLSLVSFGLGRSGGVWSLEVSLSFWIFAWPQCSSLKELWVEWVEWVELDWAHWARSHGLSVKSCEAMAPNDMHPSQAPAACHSTCCHMGTETWYPGYPFP